MKNNIHVFTVLFAFIMIFAKVNAQYLYDSVSFETFTSKILIDSTSNNVWQIGIPGKNFFNSAHSGTRAILTDTINNYFTNDTSVFIYVIRNPYTETCFTSMEFWHKYDMDTLFDKGIIDASYDGGNSWVTVSDSNLVSALGSNFWWDYDYCEANGSYKVHELIISGKSNGWILSRFNWQWWITVKSDSIIVPPDSLMIRFTFISDSVETNKEGWMIDDLLTVSAQWQLCSGIEGRLLGEKILIYPNPFSIQATLKTEYSMNNSILTIYNSFGKKVKQIENISGKMVTFSRNGLSKGFYYLFLTENNKVLAIKKLIIINKSK
ncbi:MAG: T9SS type A sorting domain-containing protein [Chlorobi bacterium]|nr:T9SS type A sorting domain-containing protein [Chlorobiota bacterium]